MKLDRKKYIIIGVSIALILILVYILFNIFNNKELETNISPIYKKINLENLTFDNASIVENNGLYTYNVQVINDSKKDYNLQYFVFEFYDKNDKQIASLIGYAKDIIKSKEKVELHASVDKDIRDAKNIKIRIEK